jgi:hypothetical protein
MRAAVWWNERLDWELPLGEAGRGLPPNDLRIDSSTAARSAYRRAARDSVFLGKPSVACRPARRP